jgi:hypothetical protein
MTEPICRACGAPIMWARTVVNAKLIPLDPKPNPKGNVVFISPGRVEVLGNRDNRLPMEDRFMPHHASCPSWGEYKGAHGR